MGRYVFDWDNVGFDGVGCGEWKATVAFAFLSAIFWLVSALVGYVLSPVFFYKVCPDANIWNSLYWVRRHTSPAPVDAGYRRRRWYRSRV